mmetsp:Transcript_134486/g.287731  ORF Transcript_134486/g.287731 Transcript_134486/m.287731 type:complete len:225 (+) Transcript_134486:404-1078(+)
MEPLPSVSISATIAVSSEGSMRRPTVSSNCSSSSVEMVPSSSQLTRSTSPRSSAARERQSCLKRLKICLISSLSPPVRPCFRFTGAATSSCFFFGAGNFSAALSALSSSLRLTSPPPSLSIFCIMVVNSWSDVLMPRSAKPLRSSAEETLPSPPVSMLLKRSLARILFCLSLTANWRISSSAEALSEEAIGCRLAPQQQGPFCVEHRGAEREKCAELTWPEAHS